MISMGCIRWESIHQYQLQLLGCLHTARHPGLGESGGVYSGIAESPGLALQSAGSKGECCALAPRVLTKGRV